MKVALLFLPIHLLQNSTTIAATMWIEVNCDTSTTWDICYCQTWQHWDVDQKNHEQSVKVRFS
jgi:hypothetical protein